MQLSCFVEHLEHGRGYVVDASQRSYSITLAFEARVLRTSESNTLTCLHSVQAFTGRLLAGTGGAEAIM